MSGFGQEAIQKQREGLSKTIKVCEIEGHGNPIKKSLQSAQLKEQKKTSPKAHPCEILETQKKEKPVKASREESHMPHDGRRIRVALGFSKTSR